MGKDYLNSEGYPDPTAFEAIRNMEKRPYRPLVYICSPYAGDVETNVSNARRYCRFAVDSGCIPIAPHLLYPQFMDDTDEKERKLGLFFGNVLMDRCAEVWVFGDRISAGMDAELVFSSLELTAKVVDEYTTRAFRSRRRTQDGKSPVSPAQSSEDSATG